MQIDQLGSKWRFRRELGWVKRVRGSVDVVSHWCSGVTKRGSGVAWTGNHGWVRGPTTVLPENLFV